MIYTWHTWASSIAIYSYIGWLEGSGYDMIILVIADHWSGLLSNQGFYGPPRVTDLEIIKLQQLDSFCWILLSKQAQPSYQQLDTYHLLSSLRRWGDPLPSFPTCSGSKKRASRWAKGNILSRCPKWLCVTPGKEGEFSLWQSGWPGPVANSGGAISGGLRTRATRAQRAAQMGHEISVNPGFC